MLKTSVRPVAARRKARDARDALPSPTAVPVVTLRLAASETPPVGQVTIAGLPPLLLRGAINLTNLTYSYTNLSVNSPHT